MSWKKALLIVLAGAIAGLHVYQATAPSAERYRRAIAATAGRRRRVALLVAYGKVSRQHGFSVRGASVLEPFVSNIVAVLVQHPKGDLLIDAVRPVR